jgi:hypothetical protein
LGNIILKGRSAHTIHYRLKNDTINTMNSANVKHSSHHGIETEYIVRINGDNDTNAYKAFFIETKARALSINEKTYYTQEVEGNFMQNNKPQQIVVDKVDLVSDSALQCDIELDSNYSIVALSRVSAIINNYHNNNSTENFVTLVRNYQKTDYIQKNKIFFNDNEKVVTIDLSNPELEEIDESIQTSITTLENFNNIDKC